MPNLTLSHFSFNLLHSAHVSSPRARFFTISPSEGDRELEALALRACGPGSMEMVVKEVSKRGVIRRNAAVRCILDVGPCETSSKRVFSADL